MILKSSLLFLRIKLFSLMQILLCLLFLIFIFDLPAEYQGLFFIMALMFDSCALTQNTGLCEQILYHGHSFLLGFYWIAEIILCGCVAAIVFKDISVVLLSLHAALLSRLFNLCLLCQLPPSLNKMICCLIAMPWLILMASYHNNPIFLYYFLSASLLIAFVALLWSAETLMKWHLEAFDWEHV